MSTLKVNNITDLGNDAVVTSGVLDTLAVPAGGILQVVSTVHSTQAIVTSSSYVDTGLELSITPTSTNSKILVITQQLVMLRDVSTVNQTEAWTELVRDSTSVYEIQSRTTTRASASTEEVPYSASIVYQDSPATTSPITYKTRAKVIPPSGTTSTMFFCLGATDSSITLMEVAG